MLLQTQGSRKGDICDAIAKSMALGKAAFAMALQSQGLCEGYLQCHWEPRYIRGNCLQCHCKVKGSREGGFCDDTAKGRALGKAAFAMMLQNEGP